MAREESFMRRLAKDGLITILIEAAKWAWIWALPLLLTGATLIAGYLQVVQWVYTLPAAALVFAATTTGLLRFDEWRVRRTPQNKVTFETIGLGFDYSRDPISGKPNGIAKAQISIILVNRATFPLNYVCDEINTSLGGRMNQNPTYLNKGGRLDAMSSTTFRDDVIDMENCPLRSPIEGVLKFKIRYGLKGHEKYPIALHLNLGAALDPNTGMYGASGYTVVAE